MKKIILALSFFSSMSFANNYVSNYFQNLTDYSAKFTQTVKQDGKIIQQSTGDVSLKKPIKFKWDYASPEPIQIISDGKDFYHYDIDLAQVTVKPVGEISSSAIMLVLNDNNELKELFNIDILPFQEASKLIKTQDKKINPNTLFYQLSAKDKKDDTQIQKLVIGFIDKKLSVFYAKDQFGETLFYFDHIKENIGISDDIFKFIAPKGVDVLG